MTDTLGTLYLIPCTLGDTPAERVLPQHVIDVARKLRHFVVEQPKTARQFLSALKPEQPIQSLHFATLNEHTAANELSELLAPLLPRHYRQKWPGKLMDSDAPQMSQNNRPRYKYSRESWALRCMDGVFRSFMKTLPPLPAIPITV